MERVLLETEKMLAHGRMDLPLSLCFATLRKDDLLLQRLLKRGLDPNESDNNGRTALHIAASKGSENCVLLLLDYGADPNSRDSEGIVPLGEAIMANNEPVVKLLADNGATLSSSDVSQFACTAAEQNNLELLKKIVHHGGDVTLPKSNGSTTALHVAVCEGNAEIVKFLVDQGADIDKPDGQGWTPRALADQQGHEEIKLLFQSTEDVKIQTPIGSGFFASERRCKTRFLGRFTSEPTIHLMGPGLTSPGATRSVGQSRPRRRSNSFHNSLFGIMSAAHGRDSNKLLLPVNETKCGESRRDYPTRVTISCPQTGDVTGKLVLLPQKIDDIKLIRDGDRIVFVSDGGLEEANRENMGS
ncbi:K+ transporter 1 [Actinidia rufa]|uniref:K+ transporter 1 n=1 Tax=Actinidia rufa TaxID=165716 RepID=A0A7J0DRR1_9ERIC|nr:K+ transporter 1 [Actinidia rufa]